MSYSVSTLLTRNLHDVFGENDPERRRAAIDDIFTEDGVFYDPSKGVYRGRDEIDRVAGAIRATHPDFRYQPIAGPEELGNGGRIQWVSGRPGEAPAYAGTDFIIVGDGRIAALALSRCRRSVAVNVAGNRRQAAADAAAQVRNEPARSSLKCGRRSR